MPRRVGEMSDARSGVECKKAQCYDVGLSVRENSSRLDDWAISTSPPSGRVLESSGGMLCRMNPSDMVYYDPTKKSTHHFIFFCGERKT